MRLVLLQILQSLFLLAAFCMEMAMNPNVQVRSRVLISTLLRGVLDDIHIWDGFPVTHPGMSLGECWRQLKFLRELQA